ISGPSATAKPMSAKIAVSSSMTWLIGCTRPVSAGGSRTGSVTSTVSLLRRASSAAAPNASLRAAIAVVTRSFKPLIAGPCTLRSSGVMAPSVFSSADTEPLLPSADTRTASSAASSLAEVTAASRSFSSCAASDIGRPQSGRQCGLGFLDDRLERRRLVDGEIGQHLAIDHDAGFRQAIDEAAVVEPERPHRGVEALDPKRAERALAPLAVAESVLPRLLHRLLGDADRVLAAAVIALGGLENFLVLGVTGDTTFDAGHDKSPCSLTTKMTGKY